uniref:Uncharacterized protein n=1 Tax=Zonotrichia albicollis TaxID=44394 RepID=A0A8D2N679_ZONAL
MRFSKPKLVSKSHCLLTHHKNYLSLLTCRGTSKFCAIPLWESHPNLVSLRNPTTTPIRKKILESWEEWGVIDWAQGGGKVYLKGDKGGGEII